MCFRVQRLLIQRKKNSDVNDIKVELSRFLLSNIELNVESLKILFSVISSMESVTMLMNVSQINTINDGIGTSLGII